MNKSRILILSIIGIIVISLGIYLSLIHIFSGITKEAKRVRWPHWTNQGSEEGTLQNTGEVLVFTIFFALFFVLCDLGVAYLMKFFGIGA